MIFWPISCAILQACASVTYAMHRQWWVALLWALGSAMSLVALAVSRR